VVCDVRFCLDSKMESLASEPPAAPDERHHDAELVWLVAAECARADDGALTSPHREDRGDRPR
jgi:hypothetical protein